MAQLGKRVLLADIDPQGNATSGLGVNKNKLDLSVYDVLINDVDAAEAIRDTMIDGLKLLPSQVDLAGAEVELVNLLAREQRLKNALAPIRDRFDYIFVDCPPSLGLLTLNALTMADTLLVPIQCEGRGPHHVRRPDQPLPAGGGRGQAVLPQQGIRHHHPPFRAAGRGPQLRPAHQPLRA